MSDTDGGDCVMLSQVPSESTFGPPDVSLEAATAPAPPPLSPFVSESAHVLSLQNPTCVVLPHESVESLGVAPSSSGEVQEEYPLHVMSGRKTITDPSSIALSGSYPSSAASAAASSVSTWILSPRRWFTRVKRGFESRLRSWSDKEGKPSIVITQDDKDDETARPLPMDDRMDGWPWPSEPECGHHQAKRLQAAQKDEHAKLRVTRKLLSKAPWRRKGSAGTFSSVGSSIREVLRGQTPPATPRSEYIEDSKCSIKSIPRFIICQEAVRVSTPPLDEYTADGNPRGFFTCTVAPYDTESPASGQQAALRASPRPNGQVSRLSASHGCRGSSLSAPKREWWETPPPHTLRREPSRDPAPDLEFQFDIPEHLPTSPLCPANSRHKSGGTGVCVYHGRGKPRSMSVFRDAADRNPMGRRDSHAGMVS
ncbi:hypothetical protein HIM_02586 [Hirsutella minnesotensis 3608]|nr:hypothetical protein HIM_02586 [Hirsutella minnesotensis 3608]